MSGSLSFSPVALPGVANVHVMDAVSVGLLVQEVKHIFDCQRKGGAPTHSAEQGLKQVVHKLLQCALQKTEHRVKTRWALLCIVIWSRSVLLLRINIK